MERSTLQAFQAARASKTDEEKAAFAAKLMADHESIIGYEPLVAMLEEHGDNPESKPARLALYKALEREAQAYQGVVVYEDQVCGKAYLGLRAKMEAFRGTFRDRRGRLIFTPAQHQAKIDDMRAKIAEMIGPEADLSLTYGPTVETWKTKIQFHQDHIDGKVKPVGTIWDFIKSDVVSPAELDEVAAAVKEER